MCCPFFVCDETKRSTHIFGLAAFSDVYLIIAWSSEVNLSALAAYRLWAQQCPFVFHGCLILNLVIEWAETDHILEFICGGSLFNRGLQEHNPGIEK